jgi:hypothetical protein
MLLPEDSPRFLFIVETPGNELNCLATAEAKLVCQKLIDERTRYATEFPRWPRFAKGVAQPRAKCSLDQLNGLCSRIGQCIWTAEAIGEERRRGCNKEEIEEFFKTHGFIESGSSEESSDQEDFNERGLKSSQRRLQIDLVESVWLETLGSRFIYEERHEAPNRNVNI